VTEEGNSNHKWYMEQWKRPFLDIGISRNLDKSDACIRTNTAYRKIQNQITESITHSSVE